MSRTMLIRCLAVFACCLLITCAPRHRRATPNPLLEVTTPAEGHDLLAPGQGHAEDRQRPPRSFEGQHEAALLNSLGHLQHSATKRREVGGSTTTPTPAGAWLLSPDTPETGSGSSVDYRTERYHISDLFAENTG